MRQWRKLRILRIQMTKSSSTRHCDKKLRRYWTFDFKLSVKVWLSAMSTPRRDPSAVITVLKSRIIFLTTACTAVWSPLALLTHKASCVGSSTWQSHQICILRSVPTTRLIKVYTLKMKLKPKLRMSAHFESQLLRWVMRLQDHLWRRTQIIIRRSHQL